MKKGKMNIVFGGQAGSEAKGKVSAWLVDKYDIKVIAGCLSPNAGHTVVRNGVKHVTHHIPAGVYGARNPRDMIVIMGVATVINPDTLYREIEELVEWGVKRDNITIDRRASIITPQHVDKELYFRMSDIGSTLQGVGAARVDKIMRVGKRATDIPWINKYTADTSMYLTNLLECGVTILYEMGQGFDLCMDHGIDPVYCTSRNCTPMQAFADAGVPMKWMGDRYAVIRTYPIRVNNRTGSSGPYPSDEITWDEVARRCKAEVDITEITTTTKLKRRVFEFSMERIREMVRVCDPTHFALQFANYLSWSDFGKINWDELSEITKTFVYNIERNTGVPVAYIGTGPDHVHMVERSEYDE